MDNFEQPCWWCSNAYAIGKCSWADNFKSVEGWNAKKTIICSYAGGTKIKSFKILKCPLFEDERERLMREFSHLSDNQLRKKIGISLKKIKEVRRKLCNKRNQQ
ncbi:MAG: hypothetical protein ACI4PF_06355 [Christensenellales bacterium]